MMFESNIRGTFERYMVSNEGNPLNEAKVVSRCRMGGLGLGFRGECNYLNGNFLVFTD